MSPDVIVIGGAVVGSATAIHLLQEEPNAEVVVVEPDPTYARASTPLASGGIRQLFALEENIRLSQYTLEVVDRWEEFLGDDVEEVPSIDWRKNGYLFLVNKRGEGTLAHAYEIQRAVGAKVAWLEREALAERFPELATHDLAGGIFSEEDGWLDPSGFLWGLRRKAIGMGAHYLDDEVIDLQADDRSVTELSLASGRQLVPGTAVVNAAGCWAPELAGMVGMYLPVEPMRRFQHYVDIPSELVGELGHLPFVIDPFAEEDSGLAVRPEGIGLSIGLTNRSHPGGFDLTVDASYFEERVWPVLAERFPKLDRLRERSTWAGLYDQNRMDGNAIVGNWPGRLDNFYVAAGFSGHGVMHALGVGRGLSELIWHGAYRTLDLARLGYQRILENRPLRG